MAKSQIVYTNTTGYIPSNLIDPLIIGGGSSTLAGDVTGASGANTVARIQGISVAATVPTIGQTLVYNGTNYAPATVSSGSATAIATTFTPTGNIAATNVQAALAGVDTRLTTIENLSTITNKGTLIAGGATQGAAVAITSASMPLSINDGDYYVITATGWYDLATIGYSVVKASAGAKITFNKTQNEYIYQAAGENQTASEVPTTPIAASPTTIALVSTNQQNTNAELATAIKAAQSGTITFATPAETETGTDTTKALNAAGTEATYIKKSVINTKGDLIVGTTDNTSTILPVGANGEVIVADNTTATGLKYVPYPFGINVLTPAVYADLAAQLLAAPTQSVTQNSVTKTVLIRDQAGDSISFTPARYDVRGFNFSTGTGTIATHFADNNEDTEFVMLLADDVASVAKVSLNINATTGVNTAATITLSKKTGVTVTPFATIAVPANATVTNGVAIAGTIITAANANVLTDNDQLLVVISGGSLTALDFSINTLIRIA